MKFPALVYKNDGPHQRAGGTYDSKLVQNQEEFDAAAADGWYASMVDAIDPPKPVEAPKPAPKTVSKA